MLCDIVYWTHRGWRSTTSPPRTLSLHVLRWSGIWSAAPILVWLRPHRQNQFAALDYLAMVDPGLVKRLAVERGGLNVNILCGIVPGGDREGSSFGIFRIEIEGNFVEQGGHCLVARRARHFRRRRFREPRPDNPRASSRRAADEAIRTPTDRPPCPYCPHWAEN